jgi:carboxyl-terminal processing protease
MKRLALVFLGVGIGFIAAAGLILPQAQGANNASIYRQFNLFSEAYEKVRANYVRPVQDTELMNGAIEGMVSGLDPHSSYMDAKAFADMQIQTKGEFPGLGIEVTMEDGLVKVVSPIDDTPAARAGIKTGDYIAAIDGNSVQGMDLNQAIEKMRGPAGTKVTLTVYRATGDKKPFDVVLTRAVIHIDSVKWRREGDVGYIRISAFNEDTSAGLVRAVRDLKKQIGPALRGYVIDLRNDPGGLLDQAVEVSDDLLNKGEIVSTRGRQPDDTQRFDARSGDITDNKPIVVLVNGGTASASEIVAGALQDHKRATVVGMTSFGKGSVQTIIPLSEGGGALRLTTARYYTPSGRSIQAEGIVPNIAVAQVGEETEVRVARPSEAGLPGHLLPEQMPGKKPQNVIRPPAGSKDKDFQLTYALGMLRGTGSVVAQRGSNAH